MGIRGRQGSNNVVNGLYSIGRESFNGRVYYEKCDFETSAYIRWHKKGMWIIDENLAHDIKGFAFNKSTQPYPHLCGNSWAIFDEQRRSFVEDENVTVDDHSSGRVCEIEEEKVHFCSVQLNAYRHTSREEDRV